MSEENEEAKLSLFYRLLLRLPKPDIDLGVTEGVFWAVLVPIFIVCEFWLSVFVLVAFAFPINIILAGIIPTTIFIFFVRIELERFISAWSVLTRKEVVKWEVEKKVEEYLQLLNRKKERKI